MEIDKRNRKELKSYFVKNAIPTESNFGEFIDAMLNQKDDGIVKRSGDPISIEAAGDNTSQKKAINFYRNFTDKKPSWTLSLNPRTDPAKPVTARFGFSINDGEGNSRLFIDRSTGNVGIGKTDTECILDVNGPIKSGALTIGPWPANAEEYVFFGTNSLEQESGQNYALVQSHSKSCKGRTFLNSPMDIRFRIGNDDKMMLANNGNVGIGTTEPKAKLEVKGSMIRKVEFATGLGPMEGINNGQIKSRILQFNKLHDETAVRIIYCDNLRIRNDDCSARWEIRFDGKVPPESLICQDKYSSTGNYHEPVTMMGYATGISAGKHEIQVWVVNPVNFKPNAPKAKVYTGWYNSRWTIEAQEVWI